MDGSTDATIINDLLAAQHAELLKAIRETPIHPKRWRAVVVVCILFAVGTPTGTVLYVADRLCNSNNELRREVVLGWQKAEVRATQAAAALPRGVQRDAAEKNLRQLHTYVDDITGQLTTRSCTV